MNWIPVNIPPEKAGEYWVWFAFKDDPYMGNATYHENGYWYDPNAGPSDTECDYISHWHEIIPPKEEGGS